MSRLKQLYLRCPDNEKPSQERLISVFLEGVRNQTLYRHLYPRKHSTFNECCLDAMDYDDNFEMRTDSSQSGLRSPPSTSSTEVSSVKEDQIIDRLLHKLGHVHRPQPPFRQQGYASQQSAREPYACGVCARPHCIEKCTRYVLGANQLPMKNWCMVCKWNATHATEECQHIARLARTRIEATRPQGNFPHGYVHQEMCLAANK